MLKFTILQPNTTFIVNCQLRQKTVSTVNSVHSFIVQSSVIIRNILTSLLSESTMKLAYFLLLPFRASFLTFSNVRQLLNNEYSLNFPVDLLPWQCLCDLG